MDERNREMRSMKTYTLIRTTAHISPRNNGPKASTGGKRVAARDADASPGVIKSLHFRIPTYLQGSNIWTEMSTGYGVAEAKFTTLQSAHQGG
jgi:hypothetical protein